MEKHINKLLESNLFINVNEEDLIKTLKQTPYSVTIYNKDEIIAIEGDDCNSLGIILEGLVEIQKVFPSGQVTTINHFKTGDIFGEALIFSDEHTYPATVSTTTNAKIMYIDKINITDLLISNPTILNNFIAILSNRIIMLSQRISSLSQDTIRKKIAKFLLDEQKKQNTNSLTFNYTRKRMAELLNIQRPSLSRELTNMKAEGIIDFQKNKIKILKLDLLKQSLFE